MMMSPKIALQDSDDDLSLIEEAQHLLAQFMGPTNHIKCKTRQSPPRNETPIVEDNSTIESTRSMILPRTPESLRPRSSQDKLPIARNTHISDTVKTARTRRSGRPRRGPGNYYDKSQYEGFGSEGEVSESGSYEGTGLRSLRRRRNRSDSIAPKSARRSRARSQASSPCVNNESDIVRPSMATPKSACSATLPSRGKQPCARRHSSETLTALLQQRQLGIPTTQRIRSKASNNLELCRTWRGASGDVIVLGWSPDGTRFAAGAAAQCDHHNMAYNRNNNLLVGDLTKNSLEELPYHWVRRPPTRAAANPNLHDARLFMSVTAVEWWDDALFTASYDNTVKLWQPTSRSAENHKRLWHDSRVEVMARSSYTPNLLATGTRSIGLWRLEEMDYQPLEARERRSNKAIEMVPSSLAWGNTQATGNILLAGMSEKGHESLTPDGQLAGWHVGEASITPLSLSPSSQNVYDIKWHPSLPYAAVANYIGHSISKAYKESRSSVRLYQPLSSKVTYMEFECPALDINDVTFCPMNTNYVTASCTDGATYVWDFRNPARILHELRHGEPLNPWDENLGREQADVGVRAALWGSTIGEFYSGGSDGVLKRWNILRAPEDALDQDVANFNEEIMSLSFSPDKSNLLVGDAAGGVHILSSGPFSRTEQCSIDYKPASPPPESMPFEDTESGIAAGAELLRSGQLERHPLFGVGQGPYYDGPFAAWARPEGTPLDEIAYTMLADECQARQIDGLDPKYRLGLTEEEKQQVAAQRRLAQIRNQRAGYKKRIREDTTSVINLCSDDDVKPPTSPDNSKRRLAKPKITVSEIEVIDLTGDPVQLPDRPVSARPMPTRLWSLVDEDLAETLEEDHWWPPNETVDANIQDMDCI